MRLCTFASWSEWKGSFGLWSASYRLGYQAGRAPLLQIQVGLEEYGLPMLRKLEGSRDPVEPRTSSGGFG